MKNRHGHSLDPLDASELDELVKNLGNPAPEASDVKLWDGAIEPAHAPGGDALMNAYSDWCLRAGEIAKDAENMKRVLESLKSDFEDRFNAYAEDAERWTQEREEMRAETERLQHENGELRKRLESAKKSILDLGTALDP